MRIEIDIICIIMLGVILFNIQTKRESTKALFFLKSSIVCMMILSSLDAFDTIIKGKQGTGFATALYISYALYYEIAAIAVFLFFKFALEKFQIKVSKKADVLIYMPMIILCILSVLSIPYKIIFSIDGDNVFKCEWGYFIHILGMSIYMLAYGGIAIYEAFNLPFRVDRENAFKFAVLLLLPLVASIFQMMYRDYSLVWPAVTITLQIYFINANNSDKNYDYLTNILNRGSFQEYAKKKIKKNKENQAIIIIDLDNFKTVNDIYGHKQGDILLKKTAIVLSEVFNKKCFVGRIGGDEFGVFFYKEVSKEYIKEKSSEFLNKVNNILKDILIVKFSCSMGICFTSEAENDYISMFQEADKALYLSKKGGRNRYTIYDGQNTQANSSRKIMLIVDDMDINRLILTNYFEKEYNIIEAKNGKEALAQIHNYGRKIACILLNLFMNTMSGRELIEIVKEKNLYDTKNIVVISYEVLSEKEITELGIADYIKIPFEPNETIEVIEHLFGKRN